MECQAQTVGGCSSSAVAALTALALLLVPTGALAEPCASTDDCAGKETCEEGECVAPEAPADDEAADDGEADDDEPADDAASAEPAADDGEGNPAMVGAGIGLLGVGVFGVGVGIGAIVGGMSTGHEYDLANATNETGSNEPNTNGFPETSDPGLQIAGGIMLGIGGAMAITGAILIPVGMSSTPAPEEGAIIVEPLLGPTYAGMRLRF
jgi:hypothetical protein